MSLFGRPPSFSMGVLAGLFSNARSKSQYQVKKEPPPSVAPSMPTSTPPQVGPVHGQPSFSQAPSSGIPMPNENMFPLIIDSSGIECSWPIASRVTRGAISKSEFTHYLQDFTEHIRAYDPKAYLKNGKIPMSSAEKTLICLIIFCSIILAGMIALCVLIFSGVMSVVFIVIPFVFGFATSFGLCMLCVCLGKRRNAGARGQLRKKSKQGGILSTSHFINHLSHFCAWWNTQLMPRGFYAVVGPVSQRKHVESYTDSKFRTWVEVHAITETSCPFSIPHPSEWVGSSRKASSQRVPAPVSSSSSPSDTFSTTAFSSGSMSTSTAPTIQQLSRQAAWYLNSRGRMVIESAIYDFPEFIIADAQCVAAYSAMPVYTPYDCMGPTPDVVGPAPPPLSPVDPTILAQFPLPSMLDGSANLYA
ncbi:hypothetical protein ADUPG1_013834 [Aduncisulcus paluster]|uniref:Uncharacterized protein n=1 Tax=Aduncisulcus paluster TaxID=2918883 RepID=A0ABQ5K4D3_9EUKA|nr:hypothetical protein ADUPG1_013834 [Aduncisulcus paluster]|eukprot:gnl/Carplike_NY0171/2419_a3251_480.p1 GENE.gnl/Carplike_NY0171/2419_a3251_480~~gnl/Carplike_NY0171/2419_a3251_480.p1  ORF type:complete len:418 (-),score=92.76 gnl/Carplike_NY0171/2419_a3251_480:326-1579(-)